MYVNIYKYLSRERSKGISQSPSLIQNFRLREQRGRLSAHALVEKSVKYTNREIVAGIRTLAEISKSNL